MGYSSRSRPTRREILEREREKAREYRRKQKQKKRAEKLFSAGRLLDLYEEASDFDRWYGSRDFLQCCLSSIDKPPIEFPGIEYEVKINLGKRLTCAKAKKGLEKLNSGREEHGFIWCSPTEGNFKTEINFYVLGEQELAIMENDYSGYDLKRKQTLQNLSFGMKGEHNVMRRKETMKRKCSQAQFHQAIEEAVREGYHYLGHISRSRFRTRFLSANTSRIFGLFSDECTISPATKPSKFQIEIEYLGYVPGHPNIALGSEKQMIKEILSLQNAVIGCCKSLKIPAKTTRERKGDFLKNAK